MIPSIKGLINGGSKTMLRIDGHYLYQVGYQIHPLSEFAAPAPNNPGISKAQAFFPLFVAKGALEPFLTRSVFELRTSLQAGEKLLAAISAAMNSIDFSRKDDVSQPLDAMHVYQIKNCLNTFEAVLGAELALLPLYVVTPKGGCDLALLTDAGTRFFPADLSKKVPDAVFDIEEAAKCMAFERFTAAGFHLHRANESVLRRYWEVVTNDAEHPDSRNMADYINGMNTRGVGDANLKAALKDLKNLHRNPLIHPDHTIKTADKAIALMNSVHTTITCMLDEIPIENDEGAESSLGELFPTLAVAAE